MTKIFSHKATKTAYTKNYTYEYDRTRKTNKSCLVGHILHFYIIISFGLPTAESPKKIQSKRACMNQYSQYINEMD